MSIRFGFALKTSIFLCIIILLAVLIEAPVTGKYILITDLYITQWVITFQSPDILQLFIWITDLGNLMFVLPLAILLCIALVILNRTLLTVPLLISLLGSTAFTYLGKIVFHRPRPIDAVLVEHSYSFPSGHATLAIGFYGFVFYLLIRHSKSLKRQLSLLIAGIIIIIMLGLSRIALNVHYLSDVLAGYMVGLVWLLISIKLTEWLIFTKRIDIDASTSRKRQLMSLAILSSAFVYYLSYAIMYQPVYVSKQSTQTIELKTNYYIHREVVSTKY